MRIGINGYFLDRPMTGSGQYLLGLLSEIKEVDPSNEYFLLHTDGRSESIGSRGFSYSAPAPSARGGNLAKVAFEHFVSPGMCKREKLDLLHVPYFGPPFSSACRTIVTIHDLIMMVLPQHRGSPAVQAYTYVAGLAARKARMIIADSECTKKDIVRLLRIPPASIRVIYLACDERFTPASDTVKQLAAQKYGLQGRFVLYMGGLDWRKNVDSLIKAFARVESDMDLAIAGKAHSGNTDLFPDLRKSAVEAGLAQRVKFLGLVDEDDKAALYSAAELFVFPSLYEGFGLTPLEAMACGTPVICSNSSSLPEVVGDGGLLFDPRNENELAGLIQRVLSDSNLAKEMSDKGLERARAFSWRRTAEQTAEAYHDALR